MNGMNGREKVETDRIMWVCGGWMGERDIRPLVCAKCSQLLMLVRGESTSIVQREVERENVR